MTGCAIHELLEALLGPCTAANLLDPTPAPYSLTSCETRLLSATTTITILNIEQTDDLTFGIAKEGGDPRST